MSEIFSLKSNLEWLNRIPGYIKDIYLGKMLHNGVYNEIYNVFKTRLFKRKFIRSEYKGVWGWNSWCGIHTFPLLTSGEAIEIYKRTVDVGFNRTEPGTGLLPHAIIHENNKFGSSSTYKCYNGEHGEAYNLDNILCWAKMAMEYALISNDIKWFNEEKFEIITSTVDYILNNLREKYNPSLIYTGIEGDWTECTNWELDNSNVNVNMLRTLSLAIECQKLLKKNCTKLNYTEVYDSILENFNKPYTEGGFWDPKLGFYIHGNDGIGNIIHGNKYFESTVNYFSILWNIAPEEYQNRIWEFLAVNANKIEQPYPVLTNYLPRTGTRRKNYGKTVTNGDIWLVLGGHAAATRLHSGFINEGSNMYKTIIDYEIEYGIIHNCIYQDGTTNDSWDPEVANYGAPFAPFVLGLLGLELEYEGLKFKIKSLTGLEELETTLFIYGKSVLFKILWDKEKFQSIKISLKDESGNFIEKVTLSEPNFTILRNPQFKITST